MGRWREEARCRIASPPWPTLSPYPPPRPPGPRAQPDQLERIWAKEERGAPERPPPPSPCAALPDWLCVPGAQLQSFRTPSEPQGTRSAATQGGKGRPRIPGADIPGAPGGRDADGPAPAASARRSSPRLAASAPLRPPPFPSLPVAASLLLRPPTPPATSPRFLIPATSALGGSFRGRRQTRGASRADAAGAARSRRRLVNGTRTRAGADTAALALRQRPTARTSRPPSRAPGEARRQCLPLAWMGLLRVGWGVSLDENVWGRRRTESRRFH